MRAVSRLSGTLALSPSDLVLTILNRTCTQCETFQCIPHAQPTSSGGLSKGGLAGAVVGALLFMVAIGVLALWYRRRLLVKAEQETSLTPKAKDVPARAEDVLNRPDPNEKPDAVVTPTPNNNPAGAQSTLTYGSYDTNVVMGQAICSPSQILSTVHNPFDDAQSIQTTGTHGSNVIQIALVPPVDPPSTPSSPSLLPNRPERSPDLNLEHLSVSQSDLRSDTASNLTTNTHRHSYLTSASTGSDFLNEVPMIITPVRSQVRQVLGVVKAEVIRAPQSPGQQSSLRTSASSRPPVRSPLANTSFGPADVLKEEEQEVVVNGGNPFTDEHTPHLSPDVSSTFGVHGSTASTISDWTPTAPSQPWNDRPTSVNTQADSIIADIGSATRVNVGLLTPTTATPMTADTSTSLHRMASARLVSPPTNGNKAVGTLEQQQQRAFSRFQDSYRDSSGSNLSAASAGEDSILESFPFVPPSPISGIPARSPRSPTDVAPPRPEQEQVEDPTLPPPPDRKALGMSTGSQISTLSAGLGSFPFQIDSSEQRSSTSSNLPPGRQRASLDTLALTADLSSYPLGFDKELQENYPLRKM